MATATAEFETLREFVTNTTPLKVDAEKGIIYGVKILGGQSKNGRTYTESAMRQAVGLYEGAKANINHPKGNPDGPRDVEDRLGSFRAVESRGADGVFGNLHYNPKCRVADALAWAAENSPSDIGFSHNVKAKTSTQGGRTVVESISKVVSVDLVADPATTNGIFESIQEPDAMQSLTEMTLEQIFAARPDIKTAVLTEAKTGAEAKERDKQFALLETEVKALRAEKAAGERKAVVDQKLTEAKLPSEVLTAKLRTLAHGMEDAELAEFIGELQGIAKAVPAKPGQRPQSSEQTAGGVTEGKDFAHVNDTKSFVEAITR